MNPPEENDDVTLDPEDNGSSDDIEYTDDNLKNTVKKLKEKIKILEKEKQEYLTGWQRTKADYVNSKKEDEERRKDLSKFANENLVVDLLPALDAYTMAQANKESWEKVDKNWRAGIEYIFSQLLSTLEKYGVAEENPLGKKLDITKHNPIGTVGTDDESKAGTVAEVIQKGYTMHGKEIRPASVKVYEKE